MVMERLGTPVPDFCLTRRILVGIDASQAKPHVFARAVDVHDPSLQIGIMLAVDWNGSGIPRAAREATEAMVAAKHGAHSRKVSGLNLKDLKPVLHFVGN